MPENRYAEDLASLRRQADVVELTDGAEARLAIVPAYQGRAMTSTAAGEDGASFGWLNAPFIASGADEPAFNNYGGEDRLWLGPEGGQFGLWFGPDEPFDLAHWRTPEGLHRGPFDLTSQGRSSVAMARQFRLVNRGGTAFDCAVQRTISLLGPDQAAEVLGAPMPGEVRMVGFESDSTLVNAGQRPWTREGGLLSLWVLGQFKPLPRGKVIVPFRPGQAVELGPKATTDYFGPVPPERCVVSEGHLLFACDGRFRSKIGVSPRRARSILGSYDPDGGVLTVVQFSLPATAPELPYVNSKWEIQERPFAGDAVNAYNDGEPSPGAGQLGPFYELETSSPAASLDAGQALRHVHRTFHILGPFDALNALSKAILGVDLAHVASG